VGGRASCSSPTWRCCASSPTGPGQARPRRRRSAWPVTPTRTSGGLRPRGPRRPPSSSTPERWAGRFTRASIASPVTPRRLRPTRNACRGSTAQAAMATSRTLSPLAVTAPMLRGEPARPHVLRATEVTVSSGRPGSPSRRAGAATRVRWTTTGRACTAATARAGDPRRQPADPATERPTASCRRRILGLRSIP
jgi:hypothetical protein